MNLGTKRTLAGAFRLPQQNGGAAGSDRMTILSLIAMDDPSERAQPRLPEITFPTRRLPGEMGWARERIPMKVLVDE